MEDFNIHGWSAIHEASYKGYSNAVIRFLNYAKDTGKTYLIELKTCDDLKATPLLIAGLGGHFEVIKILIEVGANLDEEIKYKGKYSHGLVEITVIRQDLNTLMYLYENFNDRVKICEKICNLMKNADNDDEVRSSISRTLELITNENKLKDELLGYPNFGKIFTLFVKQSSKNEESFSSSILVLLNIIKINHIRTLFIDNNGLQCLFESLNSQYLIIRQEVEKSNKKVENDEIKDDNADIEILTSLEKFDSCNLITASLGKAFCEISKYSDCIKFLIQENYGEKIIEFIKLLFDSNLLYRQYLNDAIRLKSTREDRFKKSIIFEQYIHSYLICLGNLLFACDFYKICFNKSYLYEYLLNMWTVMQATDSKNESRAASKCSSLPRITSSRHEDRDEEQQMFKKSIPFDFIPSKYYELTNASLTSIMEPAISSNLAKLLKLSIITVIGKSLYQNIELKNAYFYPKNSFKTTYLKYLNSEKNWYVITNEFINRLVEFLDPNRSVSRDVRLVILQFLINVYYNDATAISRLLETKNLYKVNLIIYLRNLLRKRCAILIREESMRTIWLLAGADDVYFTQNFKILIYKAIGTQFFVDSICDSEYLSIISLEALTVISRGPPFRESQKLVKGTEEVSRCHAIPAIIRLLKVKDELTLLALLKTILSCCMTTGYDNNYRNQLTFEKLGTLTAIFDILEKRTLFSRRLKSEGYLCLGSLVLNNSMVKTQVYKHFKDDVTVFINTLLMMLLGIDEELNHCFDIVDKLEYRILAGITITKFAYRCDEFGIKLVKSFGKIPWKTYSEILSGILSEESKLKSNLNDAKYLRIIKLKCLLGFQTAFLYKSIDSMQSSNDENDYPDPRAIGIKILIDTIQHGKNSYIRTIAIDCICRLINSDRTLVEPIITVDAVEVLCKQIEISETNQIDENEIGNCAITLAILVDFSAEGRRRLVKLSRKVPNIIKYLKYYNKSLNLDLLDQWDHYAKLLDMVKNKKFNAKPALIFPVIKKRNEKIKV